MRKTSIMAMALALALSAAPAFAETIWGTINSAAGSTLDVSVANSDAKNIPPSASIMVKDNAKFKGGITSAADLKSGDKVKLKVDEKNGAWEAKNVEKVASFPPGQSSAAEATSASGSATSAKTSSSSGSTGATSGAGATNSGY